LFAHEIVFRRPVKRVRQAGSHPGSCRTGTMIPIERSGR
jgi:hypothetical protein